MSLFFDLLSSINNPNQQGSVSQLEGIVGSLQKVASTQGIDAPQMQSMMSALGGSLGPILKQQQNIPGLDNLIGQMAGPSGASAMGNLIPPQMQQQLIQMVAQKTGMNAGMIQGVLPTVLPAIMGFLNMGASQPGTRGGNPLLEAFLSSGQGGGNDLGNVLKFATRFLNAPA